MAFKRNQLTYGLVVDWIASWDDFDYYQSIIISGVADFCKENNINLITFITGKLDSPHDWNRSRNILFDFIDKNKIDGLIVLSAAVEAYCSDETVIKKLNQYKNIPIITMGGSYEGVHSISVNNEIGMRQVIDHLIEVHGCRQIAFIKGPEGSKESETRFKTYLKSLKAHNVLVNPDLILNGTFNSESGTAAIKTLLKSGAQFDAVVAANDGMALAALEELHRHMGRIPHEISVTGFDDANSSHLRSLTTVNQPIYKMAITAADILFRMIHGEKMPLNIQLPSEMVLRSSCGCIPSSIKNTYIEAKLLDNVSFVDQFKLSKNIIIDELIQLNQSISIIKSLSESEELLKYEQKLLDGFFEEYYLNQKNHFLFAWEDLIFWCIQRNLSVLFLNDVLSCIRKGIITCFSKFSNLILPENMFQAARAHISNTILIAGNMVDSLTADQINSLCKLEEDLIAKMDWQSQLELIYQNISDYGIDKCFITLFDDPTKPLEFSRLIFACNDNFRFDTGPNGIRFKTQKLLPERILEALYKERFSVIVQVLHLGDDQLGLLIFGFDTKINRAYDFIRYRLSVALKGALLIDNIKKQKTELEKQVIERTKKLTLTNNQLLKAISKREVAEEKLKKALNTLKVHNVKLHQSSIRDELTGLYNRRGFMSKGLEQYEAFRSANRDFLVFYADLDGLKHINDFYGHSEGDLVILKTSEILVKSLRSNDVIARMGGDEFTFIAMGASPIDENIIRNRIDYNCELYNQSSDKPYKLSISIGSAYFDPKEPTGFNELLKAADEALYKIKRQKKKTQRESRI